MEIFGSLQKLYTSHFHAIKFLFSKHGDKVESFLMRRNMHGYAWGYFWLVAANVEIEERKAMFTGVNDENDGDSDHESVLSYASSITVEVVNMEMDDKSMELPEADPFQREFPREQAELFEKDIQENEPTQPERQRQEEKLLQLKKEINDLRQKQEEEEALLLEREKQVSEREQQHQKQHDELLQREKLVIKQEQEQSKQQDMLLKQGNEREQYQKEQYDKLLEREKQVIEQEQEQLKQQALLLEREQQVKEQEQQQQKLQAKLSEERGELLELQKQQKAHKVDIFDSKKRLLQQQKEFEKERKEEKRAQGRRKKEFEAEKRKLTKWEEQLKKQDKKIKLAENDHDAKQTKLAESQKQLMDQMKEFEIKRSRAKEDDEMNRQAAEISDLATKLNLKELEEKMALQAEELDNCKNLLLIKGRKVEELQKRVQTGKKVRQKKRIAESPTTRTIIENKIVETRSTVEVRVKRRVDQSSCPPAKRTRLTSFQDELEVEFKTLQRRLKDTRMDTTVAEELEIQRQDCKPNTNETSTEDTDNAPEADENSMGVEKELVVNKKSAEEDILPQMNEGALAKNATQLQLYPDTDHKESNQELEYTSRVDSCEQIENVRRNDAAENKVDKHEQLQKRRGQKRRASTDEGQPKKKRRSQRLQDKPRHQLIERRQAIRGRREARLATKKKYQLLKEEKRECEKGQVKKKAIQEEQEDPTEEEQDKVEEFLFTVHP